MADSEKAYYTAKLDMEKKEHEIRMKILLLLLWTLYYRGRLMNFAHMCTPKPVLWLGHLLKKASYVTVDLIQQSADSIFQVPSESDSSVMYAVSVSDGMCSCKDGACGKFCKHQAAVMQHMSG